MKECLGVGFQVTHASNVVYSVEPVIHIEGLSQTDFGFSEHRHIKQPLRGTWDALMQESGSVFSAAELSKDNRSV